MSGRMWFDNTRDYKIKRIQNISFKNIEWLSDEDKIEIVSSNLKLGSRTRGHIVNT